MAYNLAERFNPEVLGKLGLQVSSTPPIKTVGEALSFSPKMQGSYPQLSALPKEFAPLAARPLHGHKLRKELRTICAARQARSRAGDKSARFGMEEVLGLMQLVMYQCTQAPNEHAKGTFDHLLGDLSQAQQWLEAEESPAKVLHMLSDLL